MSPKEEWIGHGVVAGGTGEGKTTLLRCMALGYMQTRPVIAFDPYQNGYPATFSTADWAEFVAAAKQNRGCALLIDESEGLRNDPDLRWCFTGARNWEHESIFICQYHAQVPPIIRVNCNRMYMFSLSKSGAKEWADVFNCEELVEMSKQIGRYQFLEAYKTFIPAGRQKCQISTVSTEAIQKSKLAV